jgi:hypothetical protein
MIQAIPILLGKKLLEEWSSLHADSICENINEEGKFTPSVMLLAPHPEDTGITLQLGTGVWKFLAPGPNSNQDELRQQLQEMIFAAVKATEAKVLCLSIPAFVAETPEARDRLSTTKRADGSLDPKLVADDEEVYEVIYYIVETAKAYTVRMFIIERDANDRASIACEMEPNDFQISLLPHYLAFANKLNGIAGA